MTNQSISNDAVSELLLAMADDELVLGHRDSEWTGHSPILEEDIAFSNIAQDEMGHALIWYTLRYELGGPDPDAMAFERRWNEFRCCNFVAEPKGDFAYTVVRQFLFDVAEQIRLTSCSESRYAPLRNAAAKILKEEGYHRLHTQGLVERLATGTEESHRRMQAAVAKAFPEAAGMFEPLTLEDRLTGEGVMRASSSLAAAWMEQAVPVLTAAGLTVPAFVPVVNGGRRGAHRECLRDLVADMQSVYKTAPGASW